MSDVFLVFHGENYYPLGGSHDLKGCFRSPEAAWAWLCKTKPMDDWFQILRVGDDGAEVVDMGRIVKAGFNIVPPGEYDQVRWEMSRQPGI